MYFSKKSQISCKCAFFFVTSARPFPAGGFPPKVLQGNAGHLGSCSPKEKLSHTRFLFSAVAPALMQA